MIKYLIALGIGYFLYRFLKPQFDALGGTRSKKHTGKDFIHYKEEDIQEADFEDIDNNE
tara:strand:- start:10543 stop:10719 length:177 start_codon:yes stop_codon:yes gene_type:complete